MYHAWFGTTTYKLFINTIEEEFNKQNMSTKTKKTTTKKATKANKSVYTSTTTKGVYKNEAGMYRARKMINGVNYSRNFSRIADAKTWLNNL